MSVNVLKQKSADCPSETDGEMIHHSSPQCQFENQIRLKIMIAVLHSEWVLDAVVRKTNEWFQSISFMVLSELYFIAVY